MIADSPFVIKKEKVQEIQDLYEIELDTLLRALVPIAKQFAIAPISDYQVGGVALGRKRHYLSRSKRRISQPSLYIPPYMRNNF